MTMTIATDQGQMGDAMRVQMILSQYADGKIRLADVSTEVAKIQPPKMQMSWRQKLAMMIASIVILMLMPPGATARRSD